MPLRVDRCYVCACVCFNQMVELRDQETVLAGEIAVDPGNRFSLLGNCWSEAVASSVCLAACGVKRLPAFISFHCASSMLDREHLWSLQHTCAKIGLSYLFHNAYILGKFRLNLIFSSDYTASSDVFMLWCPVCLHEKVFDWLKGLIAGELGCMVLISEQPTSSEGIKKLI